MSEAKAHGRPRSHGGERGGGEPERKVSGFGRPLRGDGVRWCQTHMSTDPALRRSIVVPNRNGGEKRLSTRGSYGDVYDLTRQNSPYLRYILSLRHC